MDNNKYTIFIQDDVPLNVLLVHKIFERHGYNVIGSTDIRRAKEIIIESKPDLIFCDILEPYMSGYDFCKLIKADPLTKDIPFCFLTNLNKLDDKLEGERCGCNGYLNKPYIIEELLSTAQRLIESKGL